MQIYNDEKKRVGILSGYKNRAIVTTLSSGDKELSFEYPVSGKMVDLLKEENYIRTKTDEYVLKAIEKGDQYDRYIATLNVEELEGMQFPYGFESHEQSIRDCLTFAFEGTGWRVGTCTVLKKRTIIEEESVSAWNVLQAALSTYRCECEIDTLNKTVNIYEQIGSDKGCYFMEGLNLRNLTAVSDTYEFYTRIYPIGKDGLTPDWLTGQAYIDNFQYSKKIKAYVWKDERYTDTVSLIEDATAKIAEMSKPYVAYEAAVADLAKMSEVHKDILSYGIGDTIMLISKKKKTWEKQRIVRITEYPETPQNNTVEISNAKKTFAQIQKDDTELAKASAVSIAKNTTKKILADYPTTETVDAKIAAGNDTVELSVKQTLEDYYNKEETEAVIEVSVGNIESRVATTEGDVTMLKQTAGTVSVEAKSEQGTLSTVIANDGTWKSVFTDANGNEMSGIIFDFVKKAFLFNGAGKFTGEMDIGNGNFVVDVNGNVTAHGDTKIYGGKYYAIEDDGAGNYTMMDVDGFSVYGKDAVQRVKVGFPNDHPESPYVVLNGGTVSSASRIIMKQFTDGMWLGNDKPIDAYGNFEPATGYNGIFISLADGQTYVVAGEDKQSVYTGAAIARFG